MQPTGPLAREADQRGARLGGTQVTLDYGNADHHTLIDFRGYAYTRVPSAVSGGLITRYDDRKPEIWRVPFYDQIVPKLQVAAPRGGYIVPAAHAGWVLPKLALRFSPETPRRGSISSTAPLRLGRRL